jgi:hypothetical protein
MTVPRDDWSIEQKQTGPVVVRFKVPDEEVLVLETRERLPPIQTDQYGLAAYRANDLMQIPIFCRDRSSFSDETMDLFACLGTGGRDDNPNQHSTA